jgi:hypothetical protein
MTPQPARAHKSLPVDGQREDCEYVRAAAIKKDGAGVDARPVNAR